MMFTRFTATALMAAAVVVGAPSLSRADCNGAGEAFLGSICFTAATYCPRGFAVAAGQIIAISENEALYSLLGNRYGGDGRSTFGYPDLRGRAAVGAGRGQGLSEIGLGEQGGADELTLGVDEMPTHTHLATFTPNGGGGGGGDNVTVSVSTNAGTKDTPEAGDFLAVPATGSGITAVKLKSFAPAELPGPTVEIGGVATATSAGRDDGGTVTVGQTGGGMPFSIRSPSLGLTACIATQGLYPPRT